MWGELLDDHAALHPSYALAAGAREALAAAVDRELRDPRVHLLVADPPGLEGDTPAGFCVARCVEGATAVRETRRGALDELWVAPAARRKGLGRRLVAAALATLAEAGCARIEVRVLAANDPARAFWRAQGFAPYVEVLEWSGQRHYVPPAMSPSTLNPLAQELNDRLETAAPPVRAMLSALGSRLYFPRGILSQTAEAKEKAHRFNATIGIATEGDGPMYLPSMQAELPGLEPADVYPYAPPAGRPGLRERWRRKQLEDNPSLAGKPFGLPVVTSALTHGLALVGDLFVDPGDCILLPDKLWGNYRLTYEVRLGATIETFPFYAGDGFDTAGMREALARCAAEHEKVIVLLNFPNNPTGYMPSVAEGHAIAEALAQQAAAGTRIVALCDDAYFGLFYHVGGESMTESLFGLLTARHPNLLALRLDGATKELFAWGLRCGFLTVGPGDPESAETVCEVLDAKCRGAIRGAISNSPLLSQTLVEHALDAETVAAERAEKADVLRARAEVVHEVVHREAYRESFTPYPFNSGYFMCVALHGVEAEATRVHLLERYGVGLIATGPRDIRVAFSCLELDEIEPLFQTLHEAVQELRGA